MGPSLILQLFVLGAIWGASFLFMRTATPEFGAVGLVTVRAGIATLCLLPILLLRKRGLKTMWQHGRAIAFVGAVNTAIPFCLFSYATVELGAGMGSIINATAPMFGAMVALIWLKERLTLAGYAGLVLGFLGVAVLTVQDEQQGLPLIAVLAALAATLSYGIAANFTKQKLQGVDTMAIAAGSQIFATCMLLPFAVFTWPSESPSVSAWWQAAVLGVFCTGIAYILYFRLIAHAGAPKAMTVGYLVPVFGVMWGVLFLQETISANQLIGGTMILIGVAMTTGLNQVLRKIIRRPAKA